ncbi:putative Late nodulin [Medicago truncatula]|uniref:Putative Late nodulin n=1 Tax=Medicago truncatula TaxID=3880 RepID=A0A396HET2_MEDTR|nr:putative Late nodulin [Medicago truncatula]
MAEILKFVYIAILFVSLYLVDLGCVTDADCKDKFPGNKYPIKCINGICKSVILITRLRSDINVLMYENKVYIYYLTYIIFLFKVCLIIVYV